MAEPRDRLSPSFSFGPGRRKGADNQRLDARRPASSAPSPARTPTPAKGDAAPADATPAKLRQWVGAPKATLAIVFTDIVSSAALGNKIGNRAMDAVRRAHFRRAAELVAEHSGCLIKTIGDSVMAAFHAATDALDFAVAVHADPGDRRLHLRVGIHVGPVTVEEQDAHGTTVNYAARVVAMPRDGGVWLSSEAKGHVDQEGAPQHAVLQWQTHTGLDVKGFAGKHILWSITLQ